MDTASKDVLFTIAMKLKLPDLLRWCSSNARINKDVCNNDNVWRSKLLQDYPDYQTFGINRTLRETYVFMYQLSWIKEKLNTNESLYDIFLRKQINLSGKRLTKVPAFDLPNLRVLYLQYNSLSEVPAFVLPELQILYLNNNNLTAVPVFNLPELQELSLRNNSLTAVPAFNLPNLRVLYLQFNNLTAVPVFNLPNLQELNLRSNKLTAEENREIKEKYGIRVRL